MYNSSLVELGENQAYSIVTPALIPTKLLPNKKHNLGDEFILRRIQTLLAPTKMEHAFSTWDALSYEDIEKINSTKALVIAGANPLADDYTIVRGMTLDALRKITVPIIPFGVGITGDPDRNRRMSDTTKKILLEIHERIAISSWRCPQTLKYLLNNLPELVPKAQMTGCPVIYADPLLNGTPFCTTSNTIAITVTERGEFWPRESSLLRFIKDNYPASRKILVLHQRFNEPTIREHIRSAFRGNWLRTPMHLQRLAAKFNFEIHAPSTVDECWELYRECDIHVGSRLHAHLYFLSQAKKSYLIGVDGRANGFAEALDFRLLDPTTSASLPAQDFSKYRTEAINLFDVMKVFLEATKKTLEAG